MPSRLTGVDQSLHADFELKARLPAREDITIKIHSMFWILVSNDVKYAEFCSQWDRRRKSSTVVFHASSCKRSSPVDDVIVKVVAGTNAGDCALRSKTGLDKGPRVEHTQQGVNENL